MLGLLWGAHTVLVWASLPAQGGKSGGRQIPGTKQTKKSRNVGWASFPPELLVTCHPLISWLSLATRYREILPSLMAEISLCLWFSHIFSTLRASCGCSAQPIFTKALPTGIIFPFVRDLLSVPRCTLKKRVKLRWIPAWFRVERVPVMPLFVPLGFVHGHQSLLKCSGISFSPCQHFAVSHGHPKPCPVADAFSGLVFWIILLRKTRRGRGGNTCQELSIYVYLYIYSCLICFHADAFGAVTPWVCPLV